MSSEIIRESDGFILYGIDNNPSKCNTTYGNWYVGTYGKWDHKAGSCQHKGQYFFRRSDAEAYIEQKKRTIEHNSSLNCMGDPINDMGNYRSKYLPY